MVCTKISGQDQVKLERSILTIIRSIGRWQLGFLIKSFAMVVDALLGNTIKNLNKVPDVNQTDEAKLQWDSLNHRIKKDDDLRKYMLEHSFHIIEYLVKPIFYKLSGEITNGGIMISNTAGNFIFKVGSSIMTAGVRAGVNAAQSIPIIGIFIGIARIITNFSVVGIEVVLQTLYVLAKMYYFLLNMTSPGTGGAQGSFLRGAITILSKLTGNGVNFKKVQKDVYVQSDSADASPVEGRCLKKGSETKQNLQAKVISAAKHGAAGGVVGAAAGAVAVTSNVD